MARRIGRRSFGVGGRAQRRQTDWRIQLQTAAYFNVPAASKLLIARIGSAQLDDFSPGTLVRSRGILSVRPASVAANAQMLGAFGCAFVNETAAALGVTGIPGPATDGNFDGWFVWQGITGDFQQSTAAAWGLTDRQWEIDSKAMRKFAGDSSLVFMIENEHATLAFLAAVHMRFLIKAG